MSALSKNTYCPYLWSEAFIDPTGDVFCCCHRKPAAVGNIYKDTLKNIYSNDLMRSLRQKSIDGCLGCYKDCTLIDKTVSHRLRTTADFNYAKDLKKLKIEFGELCNIQCVMCWQDHKSRITLDHKKLIENVDLSPFNDIDIQGGEPLAIADAKAYFDYVAGQQKNPLIMTNALLINEEWAKKIVMASPYIYISLNAATAKTHERVNKGSKWDAVLGNIHKLVAARQEHRSSIKILGHMTIILENLKEIPLFIEKFRSFGFDEIDFGFDVKVPEYLRRNPYLKVLLRKKIKKVCEASNDRPLIDTRRLKILGLLE